MAHRVADDSRVFAGSFPSLQCFSGDFRFLIDDQKDQLRRQEVIPVGNSRSGPSVLIPAAGLFTPTTLSSPHLIPSVNFIMQLLVIAELGPFSVLAEKQVIQLGKNVITQFISQNKMFSMCKPVLFLIILSPLSFLPSGHQCANVKKFRYYTIVSCPQ